MGVFFMLGVVGMMLGAFATFFIYLSRRARLVDASANAGPSAPSEGTAQC